MLYFQHKKISNINVKNFNNKKKFDYITTLLSDIFLIDQQVYYTTN